MCITALIITGINEPLSSPWDLGVYCLAWAEWPLMLFWAIPRLIRRLTMRNSIEGKKDIDLVRKVVLQMKQGVVRDCMRLVTMIASERRAVQEQAQWSIPSSWSKLQARDAFDRGIARFRELSQSDKLEVWKIFESWDLNNDGYVDIQEFARKLSSVGFSHSVETSARNLLRLVDYDSSQILDWTKFKSMVALTAENLPEEERAMARKQFFQIIDADGDQTITVAELACWSQLNGIGMVEEDFANLVYKHFGCVKSSLSEDEFADWLRAAEASRNVV
eukprot:TRINITY_DN25059_c0_g1_i1.p1 TRINITY_DN25059_c0_g1~~TRINITY_DN25059_c0_g1_i1.p1  ORF type:complete len:277 (-),score=47.49 TRINITY_DN25059_c0_g1_i1:67-897(-)